MTEYRPALDAILEAEGNPALPDGYDRWEVEHRAVLTRAEAAEDERDALRATVERVRALCSAVESAGLSQLLSTGELRAALEGDNE